MPSRIVRSCQIPLLGGPFGKQDVPPRSGRVQTCVSYKVSKILGFGPGPDREVPLGMRRRELTCHLLREDDGGNGFVEPAKFLNSSFSWIRED